MPKLLKCAQDPVWRQGERELARSEVRHAGADERLFESLPGLASIISMLSSIDQYTKIGL